MLVELFVFRFHTLTSLYSRWEKTINKPCENHIMLLTRVKWGARIITEAKSRMTWKNRYEGGRKEWPKKTVKRTGRERRTQRDIYSIPIQRKFTIWRTAMEDAKSVVCGKNSSSFLIRWKKQWVFRVANIHWLKNAAFALRELRKVKEVEKMSLFSGKVIAGKYEGSMITHYWAVTITPILAHKWGFQK